jgi:hypothetical protein
MQSMLIAPSVWNVTESQVMGKFRIPKLSSPQMVQFVMEPIENFRFYCSITYDDSKEPVIVPFNVLRFLFCFDSSKDLYIIPIQWDFEKYCDIELTTHVNSKMQDWSVSRFITCKIGDIISLYRGNFWGSAEFKLEPMQLIRLIGSIGKTEESEQAIIVFSKSVVVHGLTGHNKGFVLEINKTSNLEQFISCTESNGSFKVYTKGSKPIQVEVVTKRKVVMLFEDPQNKYEFKEPITECNDLTIPEWIGQTLVYRNFENFFDIGRHISHVYFPTILDPVKKPQVACLLGLSLSALETMMFENREKIYICAELSAPFSLK